MNWILSGPMPQPREIQDRLLHHSLTKKTTLVVAVLAMAMLAAVAAFVTGKAWAYAWLITEIVLGIVRIWIVSRFERAEVSNKNTFAVGAIIAGLAWGCVMGTASYQCVVSGEWILILLSGICLAGMVGGVSSRNAGTPHYGVILMCVASLPYAAASLMSPLPHLYLVGLQLPFYLFGIILVMLENYRVLIGLYQAERENRWLANHDHLTGLPNRIMKQQRFDELLHDQRSRSPSANLPPFSVLCLDLDGFKSVNDRFGHAAGDALLVAVAQRLREHIREIDFLCRIGGDEFIILLPAISPAEIKNIATRIIDRISEPYDLGQPTLMRVGVSVGSASAPQDGLSADELLRSADRAMYMAKRRGKGRYLAHGEIIAETIALAPARDANAQLEIELPSLSGREPPHLPLPSQANSL